MDFNRFAREVHEVAVQHGWWEPQPEKAEMIAAIHSEWSEAFDAWNLHQPMLYLDFENENKPEGVAVELADGVLRLLDMVYDVRLKPTLNYSYAENDWHECIRDLTLPEMINQLHALTEDLYISADIWACRIIEHVDWWLSGYGYDLCDVMRIKHEYNKSRPIRHGGKRV